jgi:hypothetical protein
LATPSPASSLPTRQQLDEIDALLKRMLTLPPLPGEAAEPPPPALPAAPMTYPAPSVREVPPPRDPSPGEPVVREWRVEWPQAPAPQPASVVAWGSPAPAGPPSVVGSDPFPVAAPVAANHLPFAVEVPVGPALIPGQPPPSTVEPPDSLPVQFLVLVNGTFNILTYLLGPLGTMLRGPGRAALGWCGILMLLAAAVWTAGEWAGYDWPAVDLSRFGGPKLER